MPKTKADKTIAGTDESVQIVHDANVTVTDSQKRNDVKELNADEEKLIADAGHNDITYEISTEFIHSNINIVMEVAMHLHYICYYKLYRLHYNTFEEYVSEEFNYTRGRAYQLTRAYDIAKYINKKLGPTVLTTEPQCRELLRLRIYKDDELELEDKEQSNEARLALVKKIWEKDNTAKTSVIAAAVREKLKTVQAKRIKAKSVEKFTQEIQSTVSRVQIRITKLLASKEWPKDELDEIKAVAIEELKKILASLKSA